MHLLGHETDQIGHCPLAVDAVLLPKASQVRRDGRADVLPQLREVGRLVALFGVLGHSLELVGESLRLLAVLVGAETGLDRFVERCDLGVRKRVGERFVYGLTVDRRRESQGEK